MNGQKVVKVFCHEEEAKEDFDKVNDELFYNAEQANSYANMLMPDPEQHRQCAVCSAWPLSAGVMLLIRRPQPEHFRPGLWHQHCGAVLEHDQAVFRQHRARFPTS